MNNDNNESKLLHIDIYHKIFNKWKMTNLKILFLRKSQLYYKFWIDCFAWVANEFDALQKNQNDESRIRRNMTLLRHRIYC